MCACRLCLWCVCVHLVRAICVPVVYAHIVYVCVTCACVPVLWSPWREAMNALAGEEGGRSA